MASAAHPRGRSRRPAADPAHRWSVSAFVPVLLWGVAVWVACLVVSTAAFGSGGVDLAAPRVALPGALLASFAAHCGRSPH